jgi:DNA-directed RNA polymerase specialized sigma24 family protein
MIRRILVDHARNRGYAKRGGGAVRVPLEELRLGTQFLDVDVVALDQALAALGRIDPRKVRVVQLRYFAGLSVEETAQVRLCKSRGNGTPRLETRQDVAVPRAQGEVRPHVSPGGKWRSQD